MQGSTGTAQIPALAALPLGFELWEQNTAAAFVLARNVIRAEDLRDFVQLQAEYARVQLTAWQQLFLVPLVPADPEAAQRSPELTRLLESERG